MKKTVLKICMIGFLSIVSCSSDERMLPEMVLIPNGSFYMGGDELKEKSGGDAPIIPRAEYLKHEVILDRFYISKYEITYNQFLIFLKDTEYVTTVQKLTKKEDYWEQYTDLIDYPVVNVSYVDALEYCKWLSEKTGDNYRLPTEAEWEYVATGGKDQMYPWGTVYERLDLEGVYPSFDPEITYEKNVFPAGSPAKDRSDFGVLNMYSNVYEWVLDAFHPLFYTFSPTHNPLCIEGIKSGLYIVRGRAGYIFEEDYWGVKHRSGWGKYTKSSLRGFRVVKQIEDTEFNEN